MARLVRRCHYSKSIVQFRFVKAKVFFIFAAINKLNPMKKIILSALLIFATHFLFAQTTDKSNGWVKKGNFNFLVNQATFNNWLAGGQSNIAGNIGINYDFNYKNSDWNWDNKLIVGYGLTQIKGSKTQKTDDRFEFTSLLGKKAVGNWYYSAFLNFRTQMDAGYDKTSDAFLSHFLSPSFTQTGLGMLWKKSDNLKVNIAPATAKLIVVDAQFTQFGSSFGVDQGKTARFEFGAALNTYYKFVPMKNVSFENILNLYSNYLDKPKNVDIDYQLNIVLTVNKYLTTNFAFQTIYDDNSFKGFQTRQVIGVGVNYGF